MIQDQVLLSLNYHFIEFQPISVLAALIFWQ